MYQGLAQPYTILGSPADSSPLFIFLFGSDPVSDFDILWRIKIVIDSSSISIRRGSVANLSIDSSKRIDISTMALNKLPPLDPKI